MRKIKNLIGQRFGRLYVVEFAGRSKWGNALWKCKCDCGNYTIVKSCNLVNGYTKSCGCFKIQKNKEPRPQCRKNTIRTIDGKKTKLYRIYHAMIERCYDVNNKEYMCYGGRGISVCSEWKNSYENFYMWSIKSGYAEGLTIDRKDVNREYSPENCRWADLTTQALNKRISNKNSSGHIGVGVNKRTEKYVAYITVGKRRIHLGTFKTMDDAIDARERAEKIAKRYQGAAPNWNECVRDILKNK